MFDGFVFEDCRQRDSGSRFFGSPVRSRRALRRGAASPNRPPDSSLPTTRNFQCSDFHVPVLICGRRAMPDDELSAARTSGGAETPRLVVSPDLDRGRRCTALKLVLNRHHGQARLAARRIPRIGLGSRLQDSDVRNRLVLAIVPMQDDLLDLHVCTLDADLRRLDVLRPATPLALDLHDSLRGLERLLGEDEPLVSGAHATHGAHEDHGHDSKNGHEISYLHRSLPPSDLRQLKIPVVVPGSECSDPTDVTVGASYDVWWLYHAWR